MLLGTPLWELDFDLGIKAIEDPHFLREFLNEKIPEKYDRKLVSILKKMLNPDPEGRISVEEIMKKKFIRAWMHKLRQESRKCSSKNQSQDKSPEGENESPSKKTSVEEMMQVIGEKKSSS
mmetsp:Transcript_2595/g.1836  ORF Transcript_2595/g.1836 Transcript_2595/m.1836 type:complete len:121 (+) Transcript_2595:53-415(+)